MGEERERGRETLATPIKYYSHYVVCISLFNSSVQIHVRNQANKNGESIKYTKVEIQQDR